MNPSPCKTMMYRRPGSVVFIDDEYDYLEMIGLVMPEEWQVELFIRPQACIEFFDEITQRWEDDLQSQQAIVDKWHQGAPLVPQLIEYWGQDSYRYGLPQVLVIDYAMPAMNGLSLLERIGDWTGSCLMLSGRADEHIAVDAFNRGLLEQFIPKQTPDIAKHVQRSVQRFLDSPNSTRDHIWRATLTSTQLKVLRQPEVFPTLTNFSKARWTEYILVGSPFGVLGMDSLGKLEWLQLETKESLAELLELVSEQTVPHRIKSMIKGIHEGTVLTDIELQQSLGCISVASVAPTLKFGTTDTHLFGAIFALENLPKDLTLPSGYASWRAKRKRRAIRE